MVSGVATAFFLKWIIERLTPFGVLEDAVYNPELDFRRAVLEQHQIFKDATNNHILPLIDSLGRRNSQWGVLAWSRQGVQDQSVIQLRTFKTIFNIENAGTRNEHYQMVRSKLVDLPIDMVIFCNSIMMAENIEEYLELAVHDQHRIDFQLPVLDEPMPMFVNRRDDIRFEKLPSNEFGAVTIVGVSLTLTFPIFLEMQSYPVILEIIANTYDTVYDKLYATFNIRSLPDGTTETTWGNL